MYIGLDVKNPLFVSDVNETCFEKYSNIKCHENPCSWSRGVPYGLTDRTDRHDESNSSFLQFCESA